MSTCKDCIHFELCDFDGTTAEFADGNAQECRFFSNKSECMHLPFPIGTHLFRITNPYRQEPKVTEFIVTNFATVGKKHELMVEVRVNGVPSKNVMKIRNFFRTKEEAESALAERMNGGNKSAEIH